MGEGQSPPTCPLPCSCEEGTPKCPTGPMVAIGDRGESSRHHNTGEGP